MNKMLLLDDRVCFLTLSCSVPFSLLTESPKCFNVFPFKMFFFILDFIFSQINISFSQVIQKKNPVGIFIIIVLNVIWQKIDIFV